MSRNVIGLRDIVRVRAEDIRPGDAIEHQSLLGQVDRVQVSGHGYLVLPVCINEASVATADAYSSYISGWCFPRHHRRELVKVFAPADLGGRSAELRKLAQDIPLKEVLDAINAP